MRVHVLMLLVLCSSATSPAAAQADRYRTVDPVSTTGVSGFTGTSTVVAEPAGNLVLVGVKWGERTDAPCVLQIKVQNFQQPWSPNLTESFNRCPGNQSLGQLLSDNSARAALAPAPTNGFAQFIDAISVCSNGSNQKIKGIRVFATGGKYYGPGEHSADYVNGLYAVGGLTHIPAIEVTQPNCSDWHPMRTCTSTPNAHGGRQHVATGVVVHYRDGAIVGLALRCRAIEKS